MSLNLKDFYNQYGVRPLAAATQEFQPGAILKNSGSSRYQPLGDLRNVLNGQAWDTEYQDANLPQGSIEETRKGGGSIKVLGISLGGEARKASKVKVQVTKPTVQKFSALNTLQLTAALKALKAADRDAYAMIDENWVITHAWFAEELKFEFKNEHGAKLDLQIDRTDISVGASANVEQSAEGDLLITQNRIVPFGFWGFKI